MLHALSKSDALNWPFEELFCMADAYGPHKVFISW